MARTIEIDEEQFLNDQKLRQTVTGLLNHPKASLLVEQAMKEFDPNAKTPRLDSMKAAAEPVDALKNELEAAKKLFADEKAEREKRERLAALEAKVEGGLSDLRRQGWTEEGIKGVRAIMEEKGLLDAVDAAAIFEKRHPPQSPLTPNGTGAWNFMDMPSDGDADLKKLVETRGDSELLTDNMAHKALTDIRGQSRR